MLHVPNPCARIAVEESTGRTDHETTLPLLLGCFVFTALIDQASVVLAVCTVDVALKYPAPMFGIVLSMITTTIAGLMGMVAVKNAVPVSVPSTSVIIQIAA